MYVTFFFFFFGVKATTNDCICLAISGKDLERLLPDMWKGSEGGEKEELRNEKASVDVKEDMETMSKAFKNCVDCTPEDLETIALLGVGAFGRVSLVAVKSKSGQTSDDVQYFALKKISKSRVTATRQQQHIRNEKMVLSASNSPFLVKLYATFKDAKCVYFLLELCLGGELYEYIRFHKHFTEANACFYAANVILAFEYLHDRNVIYRDLKPENVLCVMVCFNGYCKLTDFGFAKIRNESNSLCGTREYLAPEVINGCRQGFGVDWWCMGIFIYEMVCGYSPFDKPQPSHKDSPSTLFDRILGESVSFPSNLSLSNEFKDLVTLLLQKDQHERLGSGIGATGVQAVKNHKWFQVYIFVHVLLLLMRHSSCLKLKKTNYHKSIHLFFFFD
ncbi:protein KINase family member (kin-1) [Reticulomyxa filosa]|uniref:Protein KINase family member (Kin-1) n=1 Tax=Reticulomyxa filosa TaxID=46433 RepID=X6NG30_RETFI|nr:protein KINase family member (kin-1) [Reticulomyxa filosa]|eukprot:ETO24906.1 protein KINase family member (kin-1) [Reticulomyxa filosa]